MLEAGGSKVGSSRWGQVLALHALWASLVLDKSIVIANEGSLQEVGCRMATVNLSLEVPPPFPSQITPKENNRSYGRLCVTV